MGQINETAKLKLCSCGYYHELDPPGYDFEEDFFTKAAQDIADALDAEIINEIIRTTNETEPTI